MKIYQSIIINFNNSFTSEIIKNQKNNLKFFITISTMSMIEKLEKISAEMFQQMLKTYHFKDVVVHKRAHAINALEYCSLYPNKGVGFKIRRRTWPKGMHYLLKEAHYKSNRFGHFIGIKFDTNGPMDQYPKRLQGLNKRGIWEYDLGNFESFTTDNNVTYTRADYEAYFNLRAQSPSPKVQEILEANRLLQEQVAQQGVQIPEVGFSEKSQ